MARGENLNSNPVEQWMHWKRLVVKLRLVIISSGILSSQINQVQRGPKYKMIIQLLSAFPALTSFQGKLFGKIRWKHHHGNHLATHNGHLTRLRCCQLWPAALMVKMKEKKIIARLMLSWFPVFVHFFISPPSSLPVLPSLIMVFFFSFKDCWWHFMAQLNTKIAFTIFEKLVWAGNYRRFWTITIDLLKFLCLCKPAFFSLSPDHKFLLLWMLSIIFFTYSSSSFNKCLNNCLALHFFFACLKPCVWFQRCFL